MGFTIAVWDLLKKTHSPILTFVGESEISAKGEKSIMDWYGPLRGYTFSQETSFSFATDEQFL